MQFYHNSNVHFFPQNMSLSPSPSVGKKCFYCGCHNLCWIPIELNSCNILMFLIHFTANFAFSVCRSFQQSTPSRFRLVELQFLFCVTAVVKTYFFMICSRANAFKHCFWFAVYMRFWSGLKNFRVSLVKYLTVYPVLRVENKLPCACMRTAHPSFNASIYILDPFWWYSSEY